MHAKLHALLLKLGLSLSAAESCTGGWISKLLTDTPGSSGYFLGGVVAYSNELKTSLLKVPADLILRHGAVSEEVCREMCVAAQSLTGSDLAVSVTGIAGPDGGSPGKPVGTVYAGFFVDEEVIVKKLSLRGSRNSIRLRTCGFVLSSLYALVLERLKAGT